MQAKLYGVMKDTAQEIEFFCRQSRINIVIDSNEDDTENITINSIENECAIASCFKGERIMIQSFYDFRFPSFIIDCCDFERMVII